MQHVAHWILRIGLMATFLYAGVDMIVHPAAWVGFFPGWIIAASPLKDIPLAIADGIVQIILALGLLHPKFFRWSAGALAIMLFGILVATGPFFVTFRDIGLLAMALAIVVYPSSAQTMARTTPVIIPPTQSNETIVAPPSGGPA